MEGKRVFLSVFHPCFIRGEELQNARGGDLDALEDHLQLVGVRREFECGRLVDVAHGARRDR